MTASAKHPDDASPHVAADLNFDATRYGVDVDAGVVDGERIGVMAALVCAIARRELWPDADTVPYVPARRRLATNGNGAHAAPRVDIDLTLTA